MKRSIQAQKNLLIRRTCAPTVLDLAFDVAGCVIKHTAFHKSGSRLLMHCSKFMSSILHGSIVAVCFVAF